MNKEITDAIGGLSATIFEALDGSSSKGGVKDALNDIAEAINRLADIMENKFDDPFNFDD